MATNVRVEAKHLPSNSTQQQKDDNSWRLIKEFKRECGKAGVLKELRERESFESESRKRRRKRKESKRASVIDAWKDQERKIVDIKY
jgi:ribosomal protein S21